jgi:glycosyltransferase involved in cell wall biosynthesis
VRILHVITGLTTGGAEAVLYRLAASTTGVEHEVICLESRAWYSDKLEALGIRVHHVDWTAVGSLRAIVKLHRLMRAIDADVVQTWMYRSNVFAGVSCRLLGKPVVWNIRCSTFDVYPLATRILARAGGYLARWVPRRIINCSVKSQQLHARIGYDSCPVDVIPNGYDAEAFGPDEAARAITRQALNADPRWFLIASIARWHPQKGLPELLAAMRLLREHRVPVKLQLVGRGLDESNPELERLIAESGCAELIQLIGERSDIPAIARVPDVHVVSSIAGEGFPNAIAETMLSGTPNVTTDVGDAAYIVGDTGWTVPPGDPEQLAAAIEEAYSEWAELPDQWRDRRAAARERIAANFTIDRMVEKYEEVWSVAARTGAERTCGDPAPELADAPHDAAAAPEPLRILHVINGLTLGGAEALLYRLVTRDRIDGHVVVSLGGPGWYTSRLREKGVTLHHLGIDSPSAVPAGALQLNRLIRNSGADVVQCWMYHSNLLGGLVAKLARKPVVWGIHNTSLDAVRPRSRAVARLGGVLARWIPDFVVNCSDHSAELHRRLGYSAAAGAVIHNGYKASVWFPDEDVRRSAREALGIGPREFVAGSIARWDPQKDVPNLLAAVRVAYDRGVPLRCLLIGAGLTPENAELDEAIQRNRCNDLVVPLGPRGDIQDLARALDLHVLASCSEAFPNVVAETMLSGTPNVVTDVGDSAAMVGASGWVVPPSDPEGLASAIVDAFHEWKDSVQWQARRNAAREQIAGNFSFEGMAQAYRQVWQTVASGRLTPP